MCFFKSYFKTNSIELNDDLMEHYTSGRVVNSKITRVIFEPGIESISDKAFYGCDCLVRVRIPASVTSIGGWAFTYCTSLKAIVLPPGLTKIESLTFQYCRSLEQIDLPSSITEIGEGAFAECSSLESIEIPMGVKNLGSKVFAGSHLREISVPDGIQVIPERAFYRCESLRTIKLPASIKEIGFAAFSECLSLVDIAIPNDGLFELKKLNLESDDIGHHGFSRISHLVTHSPNLEEVSIQRVETGKVLNDADLPALLQLVTLCPSLRALNLSNNCFTPKIFEMWASEHLPRHLRTLSIRVLDAEDLLLDTDLQPTIEKIEGVAFDFCCKRDDFVIPNGLYALKKINLDFDQVGMHGWYWIRQLVANSPNLEELSLQHVVVHTQPLKRTLYPISLAFQWASLCPSLRSLSLSSRSFTPNVFKRLVSEDIPHHLQRLSIWGIESNDTLSPTHLLRLLDIHPKLAIWTNVFWDESEDKNVWHKLNMNQYGCRTFTLPDSLWPTMIERLGTINATQGIETGVANILFHLLSRHPGLFVRARKMRDEFDIQQGVFQSESSPLSNASCHCRLAWKPLPTKLLWGTKNIKKTGTEQR